jgi:predicted nucleotidyltransferase component of viral defense system
MNLHLNPEIFQQLLIQTSRDNKIDIAIVEKDYYVTLFLKKMIAMNDKFILKGGTSLSKCYHAIKRFSEDIDICHEGVPLPDSKKKKIKEIIKLISIELGFSITNLGDTRSSRDFNRYEIDYHATHAGVGIKPDVIVETTMLFPCYPIETKTAASLIFDYLKKITRQDVIDTYDLAPFSVKVQSIERTFLDKIYAICDYFLSGKIEEHSRHLYDLHQIYNFINIDIVREINPQVRKDRSGSSICLSAPSKMNITEIVSEIINKGTYRADYESITTFLLFDDISYDDCIKTLKKIIDLDIF